MFFINQFVAFHVSFTYCTLCIDCKFSLKEHIFNELYFFFHINVVFDIFAGFTTTAVRYFQIRFVIRTRVRSSTCGLKKQLMKITPRVHYNILILTYVMSINTNVVLCNGELFKIPPIQFIRSAAVVRALRQKIMNNDLRFDIL